MTAEEFKRLCASMIGIICDYAKYSPSTISFTLIDGGASATMTATIRELKRDEDGSLRKHIREQLTWKINSLLGRPQ